MKKQIIDSEIKADLHIHTSFSSDAEHSPEDIVKMCAEAGVQVFSVADHNTVKGLARAERAAGKAGITFIPAVEIDCNYEGTDMHMLGYGINYESADFDTLEWETFKLVRDAFGESMDLFRSLGFEITDEEVLLEAGENLPTGELIGEILLKDPERNTHPLLKEYLPGGKRSDMPCINFWLDFCTQGKPAYVPMAYIDFEEALMLVKDNGGTAVIAHPAVNFRGQEEKVRALLNDGAEGLEVFNNYHDGEQSKLFAEMAVNSSVLMTCGSDFHGKNKPLIKVGEYRDAGSYGKYLAGSVRTLVQNAAGK